MTETDPSTTSPTTVSVRDLRETIEERSAAGKAARERAPRSAFARWDETARGHDALDTIVAQNAIRVPELLPVRHGSMVASPWNYYRGAAAVMAADLASRPHSGLLVQLCGDAHVLNFGLWATPERNLMFDLRDFDETLPGPFEWDVSGSPPAWWWRLGRTASRRRRRMRRRSRQWRRTGTAWPATRR
jgi:hypothetical protein